MAKKIKQADQSNFIHFLSLCCETYQPIQPLGYLLPACMPTHLFSCLLAQPQIHLLNHLLTCMPIYLSIFSLAKHMHTLFPSSYS